MDWPAVKQYISQNTVAIVVGLIITLLVAPFLKGLVKWPFNYIRECLKRRKQNIAIQKKLLSFTQKNQKTLYVTNCLALGCKTIPRKKT